jgi:hypothetical protein
VQWLPNKNESEMNSHNVRTTDITMLLNMGFLDGEEERKMQENEAQSNVLGLTQHMKDILPDLDDLDLDTPVQSISLASLHLGKWPLSDGSHVATYSVKLTITLRHEAPASFAAVQAIIDAIYENGANFPFTPDAEDALPYTFLYPYHSTIADVHSDD